MGFGQLLATLFFAANFLTYEPYYMWPAIICAVPYGMRTVMFFTMVYSDESQDSINRYYQELKYTTYAIAVGALSNIGLKWAEWQHAPVWMLVFWTIIFTLNHYHGAVVMEWGSITDDGSFYSPFSTVSSARVNNTIKGKRVSGAASKLA